MNLRARSIEAKAQRCFTPEERQRAADAASRVAWADGGILILARSHPALDAIERQMVDHLAKRIGAAK